MSDVAGDSDTKVDRAKGKQDLLGKGLGFKPSLEG